MGQARRTLPHPVDHVLDVRIVANSLGQTETAPALEGAGYEAEGSGV